MKTLAPAIFTALAFAGCSVPQYQSTSHSPDYSPPTYSAAPAAAPVSDLRSTLEGCMIVAEDGQALGVITANAYDSKSFLNQYGAYGSKYSATSIWNEYGQYGGEYSAQSPFNPYTNTPPRIITPDGQLLGYLTVNKFKMPNISAHAVAALMR